MFTVCLNKAGPRSRRSVPSPESCPCPMSAVFVPLLCLVSVSLGLTCPPPLQILPSRLPLQLPLSPLCPNPPLRFPYFHLADWQVQTSFLWISPHPYFLPSVESVPSSLTISSNVVTHGQQGHLQLTASYDTSTQTAMKFVVHAERRILVALPKKHCTRLTSDEVHTLSPSCTHLLILRMRPV